MEERPRAGAAERIAQPQMTASWGPRTSVATPAVWEVAALVRAIDDSLAARFPAVTVRGELSGYAQAGSGHCYFSLKSPDGSASLRCAMFRRAASMVTFAPRDGLAVELRGRLAIYPARGDLQFVAEAMRLSGEGDWLARFMALKARLEREGLFDASRKRPIAPWPRRLGLVTSLAAAALHDVLTAWSRRAPHVEVVIYPAAVQGAEAGAQLARAVDEASARAEVDTLVVCRGGGAMDDLWAFNDERLVRAIARASMPVISGVGHETDFTLCDFAADLRAPTPTAAAELAAADREDALMHLEHVAARLQRRMSERLEREAQHLDHAASRWLRPTEALKRHADRLTSLESRMARAAHQHIRAAGDRHQQFAHRLREAGRANGRALVQALALRQARLAGLDPARVLARGYALLAGPDGRPITSVSQVRPHDRVAARLHDGQVTATVVEVQTTVAKPKAPRSPRAR